MRFIEKNSWKCLRFDDFPSITVQKEAHEAWNTTSTNKLIFTYENSSENENSVGEHTKCIFQKLFGVLWSGKSWRGENLGIKSCSNVFEEFERFRRRDRGMEMREKSWEFGREPLEVVFMVFKDFYWDCNESIETANSSNLQMGSFNLLHLIKVFFSSIFHHFSISYRLSHFKTLYFLYSSDCVHSLPREIVSIYIGSTPRPIKPLCRIPPRVLSISEFKESFSKYFSLSATLFLYHSFHHARLECSVKLLCGFMARAGRNEICLL
jgi:hypothetical protein